MYFPDLTPYHYAGHDFNFLHIGWLKNGQDFPVGECPTDFAEQLLQLCRHPVNLMRGFHHCDLCPSVGKKQFDFGRGLQWDRVDTQQYHLQDGRTIWTSQLIIQQDGIEAGLGNGEVEVIGREGVGYRAPTLIYHYVTVHQYRPPQEFIDAVLQTNSAAV